MPHIPEHTEATVNSLNRLNELLKLRQPQQIAWPVEADITAIALAAIRLLLDLSIYVFMTGILVMGVIFLFSIGNEETLTKAKRTLTQSLIGLVIAFSSFAALQFFTSRLAAPLALGNGATVATVFGKVYNLVLLAAGAGFVIILMYAGVRFLFAGGNEESQAGAKKMISAALYGLMLTLGSYAISQFLLTTFGAITR